MTAYTSHPDAIFDPDKPILGSTHLEVRDNLIAVLEGDDTAPHLALPAIERVVAGNTVRSNDSNSGADFEYDFAFLQAGTVRIKGTSNANESWQVLRFRNGSVTSLGSGSAVSSFSLDVSVSPFDTIRGSWVGTGNHTISFCTDGGNLWCGNPSQNVGVTGNEI